MKNLIKYEIRSNYKAYLSMYLFMILGTLVALSRLDKWLDESILTIIGLICAAGVTLTLAISLSSLSRELKKDSRHLIYSLPVSSSSIVFSKILTGLMWINIVGLLTVGIAGTTATVFFKGYDIPNFLSTNLLLLYIMGIGGLIQTFASIFFAVSVSKLFSKFGTLIGIVVFLAVNSFGEFMDTLLLKWIPSFIQLGTKSPSISSQSTFGADNIINIMPLTSELQIHLPSMLFQLIMTVLLIYGTIYILDRKLDL